MVQGISIVRPEDLGLSWLYLDRRRVRRVVCRLGWRYRRLAVATCLSDSNLIRLASLANDPKKRGCCLVDLLWFIQVLHHDVGSPAGAGAAPTACPPIHGHGASPPSCLRARQPKVLPALPDIALMPRPPRSCSTLTRGARRRQRFRLRTIGPGGRLARANRRRATIPDTLCERSRDFHARAGSAATGR